MLYDQAPIMRFSSRFKSSRPLIEVGDGCGIVEARVIQYHPNNRVLLQASLGSEGAGG